MSATLSAVSRTPPIHPTPSPLRTCALEPDTGASIMRSRGATASISAAMRSGSQVEAHSTVLATLGVEHRGQDDVAACDLMERRCDPAGLGEGRDLGGIDVIAFRAEPCADQPG